LLPASGPGAIPTEERDLSTATSPGRHPAGLRAVTAARAVATAVLAAVVTFSADHTPPFGLLVFGAFAVVQGVILGLAVPSSAGTAAGRMLVGARAVVSVVLGATALSLPGGGLGSLLLIETVAFLVLGVLEVLSGLRRADANAASRDAITVGGLELVVGVMLSVLPPDAVFAVGVLGAWGAIVAVYLGIAAASLSRRERSA
jgi:uncharacterized membrane protein HdeD (DUF308 family)